MTEKQHLWKIKLRDKAVTYVVTEEAEYETAVKLLVDSLFGKQASFKGLEPEHPIEKLEYLGAVIT
jgi:hypothetical protein